MCVCNLSLLTSAELNPTQRLCERPMCCSSELAAWQLSEHYHSLRRRRGEGRRAGSVAVSLKETLKEAFVWGSASTNVQVGEKYR